MGPSAFEILPSIDTATSLAVFLDYDGTLAPIALRPQRALLDPLTREAVRRLATVADVAVVSGRGLDDVRAHVDVPGLAYAGSHGLELLHRNGRHEIPLGAQEFVSALHDVASELQDTILKLPGTRIEAKPLAVAVHFRETPVLMQAAVVEAVRAITSKYAMLRTSDAKKVVEVRPNVAWSKGTAVATFLQEFGGDALRRTVLCFGDDTTDEDAYPVVQTGHFACGAGIFVGNASPPGGTSASYSLRQSEVRAFIEELTVRFEPRSS